jgi:hypothetical protein
MCRELHWYVRIFPGDHREKQEFFQGVCRFPDSFQRDFNRFEFGANATPAAADARVVPVPK